MFFASRYFLLSGFDDLSGNVGDARLVLSFVEHWRAVFSGAAKWDSPFYFYPFSRAMSLQDGFFLFGLAYTPLRFFLDTYSAAEAAFIVIRGVGFLSMALLLRNGLRLPHWAAIFGAILFTIAGNLYRSMGHSQNLSACYVPVLMWLLLIAFTRHDRFARWLALPSFVVVYCALWFTSFYFAWYFLLFLIILTALLAGYWSFKLGPIALFGSLRSLLETRWPSVVIAGALGAMPAYSFLNLYLQGLRTHGGWPWPAIEAGVNRLSDMVSAGPFNLI